jgi:hypothetical protein
MTIVSRALWVAGLCLLLGCGLLSGVGCGTGGGLPQQLEPTKPRMDAEKETDTPAPKAEPAK